MRLIRAAAATVTLLVLLAGVPWLLLHTIGNPAAAWPALIAGDVNDQVVYSLLAAVAWIAWAQFTVAFLIELISGLRRSPMPRPLPGVFGFQQLSARALITAALMLTPAVVNILAPTAVAVAAVAPSTATSSPSRSTAPTATKSPAPVAVTGQATHTVTISATGPRTWWDLAEQHLGAGSKWSQLWALNHGRPQIGGVRMNTPGPLRTGWTVLLPAPTITTPASLDSAVPLPAQSPALNRAETVVTVRPGDSLSAIATRHQLDWTELWQANEGRHQAGGTVLTDPDYLEPGWTIIVPVSAASDPDDVQVQPGDTLIGIANAEHIPWEHLWDANRNREEPGGARITDPNYLEPGWTLDILAPSADPSPTPNPAKPPKPSIPAAPTRSDSAGASTRHSAEAAAQRQAAAARAERQDAANRAAERQARDNAEKKAQAVADTASAKEAREQRDADALAATNETSAKPAAPTHATVPSAPEHSDTNTSSIPAVLTGGGGLILAGLVVAALRLARRRQFRWRRPGRTVPPTPPELMPMERALTGSGRNAAPDVAWLDLAMRSLAAGLRAAGAEGVPPVIAARLADDSLELVMALPTFDAPQPWAVDESGLLWAVSRIAELTLTDHDRERTLAPFPALACVGHTADGEHWLIDLEMVGTLAIRGDRTRAIDLARYLAAELAHNTWSDSLQVTLVGFGREMAAANPDRLSYSADPDDARRAATTKTATVQAVITEAAVQPAAGRLHNIAGDTWATHVLLIDTDGRSAQHADNELWTELGGTVGRQALAVVLIDPAVDSEPHANWTVTLDAGGTLSIPALDLQVEAEQLPASEAAALAQLLALATRTDDEAPTPADGDNPWDEFADATGALVMRLHPTTTSAKEAPTHLVDAADGRDGSVLPLAAHTYVAATAISELDIDVLAPKVAHQTRARIEQADPHLDDHLNDWHDPNSRTPKVTVLGPVDVQAQGALDPQRPRRAWNVEVVTYLATRPHGATAEQFGAALWPDEPDAHEKSKLRNAISTARRWLGRNPATGQDYVPVNPGIPGSVYRVEGVLVDAELFRRLRIRATGRGAAGIDDLESALQLVTGPPFDALRPGGYGWLADQALDHAYTAMIADVSHLVATHHLGSGNPEKAMAAAQVALLAGSFADEPLLDCAAACYDQGLPAEGATYVKRILNNHDAEVEEELPPRTYEVLRRRGWLVS